MNGFFLEATQATVNLVSSYGAIFLATGIAMFRTFAVVRVVWESCLIAFGGSGGAAIPRLFVMIAITYTGLSYYSAPIPGVGKSLTKVVTDGAADLAQVIDTTTEEDVVIRLANIMNDNAASGWTAAFNATAAVRYYMLGLALVLMQAVVFGVLAFGFVVAGVMVVVGPIFIPFLIVPGLDWLATNWFSCLLQYSFYPVIGNAFVFVYGQVWMNALTQFSGPVSAEQWLAKVFALAVISTAGIYGLLKVPQVVSNLFGGSSGLSAGTEAVGSIRSAMRPARR